MSNNGYDGAFVWTDGNQRKITITYADYKKKSPKIINIDSDSSKDLVIAFCKKFYQIERQHIEFQDD